MKNLLKYLKNYKKQAILAPLFKMLEASFELLVPLVVAGIIDVGIKNKDYTYIAKMGTILVLLGIVGLVWSITAQYFAAKAAVGFGTELRHILFEYINNMSFDNLDKSKTSTLVTRMTSDINQVQQGVNMVLRLFLRSPFIVLGAAIMAFTINFKAGLVFVITIPVLSLIVFGIMVITMPLYKKVQSKLDKVLLLTKEGLSGVRVVRAFNNEEQEKKEFLFNNEQLTISQKHVGKISALLNPITFVVVNIGIVVLIWTGAIQVNEGFITQGELVALVNYMSQILVELIKLANLIVIVSKAIACGNRVNDVFEIKNIDEENHGINMNNNTYVPKENVLIEYNHVDFKYSGSGNNILSDINFKVNKGDTVGIIGGTGSGKSTLVNLLLGFYKTSSGSIFINGENINNISQDKLQNRIGIVLQKAVLFSGTIEQNIKWGKKNASQKEIMEALEISQSKDFVKEKGLDFFVNSGGKNLSGGQKQRLTIARTIIKKPEILILDDSTSALDFSTEAKLRKDISDRLECTCLIISQRVSSIMKADKILVIDDGCIVGAGKHDELIESCSIYKEICMSQLSVKDGAK